MKIHRSYRFRIYPTAEQIARVSGWEHALRYLWNTMHAERLHKLEFDVKLPSAFDQINDVTVLRKVYPWLAEVPRDVTAQVIVELDKAWQRCFRKMAQMPRFKRKIARDRAPMIESHAKKFRVDDSGCHGTVVFPKLGAIRTVIHRRIEGVSKTCAIVRDGDRWFVAISCEIEIADPAPSTKPAVAIDRGVVNLIADSDGRVVPGVRPMEALRARVAKAQRRVAHKTKGSKNQKKARVKVARLQRKARLQREAVLHSESKHYTKNHGVVIVEQLDIRSMTKSASGTIEEPGMNVAQKRGLNRAILDAGWGKFAFMLRYKAEREGVSVVEVRAAYSSQTCAVCGVVDGESRRSQSEFECVACGHKANADVNAAKVLLSRGMHGGEVCGGDVIARPTKQKLRVVKRVTRTKDRASASAEASGFGSG
jgi:putative transposase